jgi:hypothetical protein
MLREERPTSLGPQQPSPDRQSSLVHDAIGFDIEPEYRMTATALRTHQYRLAQPPTTSFVADVCALLLQQDQPRWNECYLRGSMPDGTMQASLQFVNQTAGEHTPVRQRTDQRLRQVIRFEVGATTLYGIRHLFAARHLARLKLYGV